MAGISEILGGPKRSTTVRVPLNTTEVNIDELYAAAEAADARVGTALQSPGSLDEATLDALVTEAEQAAQAVQDSLTAFTFEPIGKEAWADLLAAHPPMPEDKRRDPQAETAYRFQPVAVAASCVDPVLTEDEAVQLQQHVSDDLWDQIYSGALAANRGGGAAPFLATAGIVRRAKERSATTRAAAESHAASS